VFVVGIFDAIPLEVNVGEDIAKVSVQYYGDEGNFWHDFFGMALGIIEEAPWVRRIQITYVGEENITITVDTNTVLDVYTGKIDAKDVITVLAIGVAIVGFSTLLVLAQFYPNLSKPKKIYEAYFDLAIVLSLALIATFLAVLGAKAYAATQVPRLIYVTGAFALYALRMYLTFFNMLSGPNHWLIDSAVHIMDLGVLALFFEARYSFQGARKNHRACNGPVGVPHVSYGESRADPI